MSKGYFKTIWEDTTPMRRVVGRFLGEMFALLVLKAGASLFGVLALAIDHILPFGPLPEDVRSYFPLDPLRVMATSMDLVGSAIAVVVIFYEGISFCISIVRTTKERHSSIE